MLTNCLAACAHLAITVSEIERDIYEKIVILPYPLAFDAPVNNILCRKFFLIIIIICERQSKVMRTLPQVISNPVSFSGGSS